MKPIHLLFLVPLYVSLGQAESKCDPDWNQIGPGGGGRISSPAISPHDSNLLLAGSDMDGVYRSSNSGQDWMFLPASEIQGVIPNSYNFSGGSNYYETRFAFHPTSPTLVFAGTKRGMKVSRDSGLTWKDVAGDWNGKAEGKFLGPTLIEFSRQNPQFAVAAFNDFKGTDKRALFITSDGGTSWRRLPAFPTPVSPKRPCARVVGVGLDIDPVTPALTSRTFVVACNDGLYRTKDEGKTFVSIGNSLPDGGTMIKDLVWSRGQTRTSGEGTTLYVLPSCNEAALFRKCRSPLYSSQDQGTTWTPSSINGLFDESKVRNPDWHAEYLQIGVSPRRPDTIYLTMKGVHREEKDSVEQLGAYGYGSVYVSTDYGQSWKNTFFRHPRQPGFNFNESWRTKGIWGWHLPPEGISVFERDPRKAFVAEALTYNAGDKWYVTDTLPFVPELGEATRGGGIPIMGAWDYFYAPDTLPQWGFNLQFAAMIDFPSWRSVDGGKAWLHSYPKMNNVYTYGFDTASAKILAGGGFVHDLLNWRWLDDHRLQLEAAKIPLGVVAESADGESWTVVKRTPGVVTSIHVLAKNDYLLGIMGVGVGRLKNGDFTDLTDGIGYIDETDGKRKGNLNVYHVGRTGDKYYAMTVLRPEGREYSAGLVYFKSALLAPDDPKNPWVPDPLGRTTGAEVGFPVSIEFDPDEPETYYVAALSTPHEGMTRRTTGGVWKRKRNTQKKVEWSRLLAGDISDFKILQKAAPGGGNIFVVTEMGVGVKFSTDEGKTWHRYSKLPISNPRSISEDPRTAQSSTTRSITITTFGQGIWRGWPDCSENK